MDQNYPIYTSLTECHDCYKCVRECPVKAIKINNGRAGIIAEKCILCGKCLQVCPANAKRIRSDIARAQLILSQHETVIASIAPSWVSEFKDISVQKLISTIKELGFKEVSETAIGADIITRHTIDILENEKHKLAFSSACPVVNKYVDQFYPQFSKYFITRLSPAMAHAQYLKEKNGQKIRVVFIGPCPAKKVEADHRESPIDLVLTFKELRNWFNQENIDIESKLENYDSEIIEREIIDSEIIETESDESFFGGTSSGGSLYPIPGGTIAAINMIGSLDDYRSMSVSGIENIMKTLASLNPDELSEPYFIELLACQNGCVEGPAASHNKSFMNLYDSIKDRSAECENTFKDSNFEVKDLNIRDDRLYLKSFSEESIKKALNKIGKFSKDDELNCSGCGYNSCRDFAVALIKGDAEVSMCVSYMRKVAAKKANALLRCIPSGVVIIDKEMKIVECNKPFSRIFGEEAKIVYDTKPGMEGALISKILPIDDLFKIALRTGNDIVRDHFPVNNRLLNIVIFTIEHQKTLGAIVRDVTETEMEREQIAESAREVIQKNIETVQEIACRLGEHMADTEIILNSIARNYSNNLTVKPDYRLKSDME